MKELSEIREKIKVLKEDKAKKAKEGKITINQYNDGSNIRSYMVAENKRQIRQKEENEIRRMKLRGALEKSKEAKEALEKSKMNLEQQLQFSLVENESLRKSLSATVTALGQAGKKGTEKTNRQKKMVKKAVVKKAGQHEQQHGQ